MSHLRETILAMDQPFERFTPAQMRSMQPVVAQAATESSASRTNELLDALIDHQKAMAAQQEAAAQREQRIMTIAFWTLIATCGSAIIGLIGIFVTVL